MRVGKPILMNGEMVRATLEGRKTQTRRVMSPQLSRGWVFGTASSADIRYGEITSPHPRRGRFGAFIKREVFRGSGKFEHDLIPCPCGQPGDLIWVRETFQGPLVDLSLADEYAKDTTKFEKPEFCVYAADGGGTPEFVDLNDDVRGYALGSPAAASKEPQPEPLDLSQLQQGDMFGDREDAA